MKSHSERLVKLAEILTPILLEMQVMDSSSKNYGGIIIPNKGYSEPSAVALPIMHFVGMYYHPDSSYYKDADLLKRTSLLLDVLINNMHDDGTMDIIETNFHDATLIGFIITPLAYTYRVMLKHNDKSSAEKEITDKMMLFFKRGAEGMRQGGFHTPNHRWVMAASLSLMANILDNPIYKDEALKFINEGIDCDEEGEYIERSVAIYDITVNESLIVIAQELDMPELIEFAARNLKKNYAYFEPDGSICTLNSTRQDNSIKYYPLRHYWSALYVAHCNNDPLLASMAEYLLTLMEKKAFALPSFLFTGGREDVHTPIIHYLLNPKLSEDIQYEKMQWDGHWYFPKNGIVRYRKEKTSFTLLRDREVFLRYQNGDNILTAKIGTCFFGKGYFKPTVLEKTDSGYRLTSSMEQGYYKPLDEKIEDKDFYNIRNKRIKTHVQKHNISVDILLLDDEIKMKIKIDGVEDVPLKIELMLSEGGRLQTDDIIIEGYAGNNLVLKKGDATYTLDRDIIKIRNGVSEHWNTGNMRGTLPASKDHFTIYMTGFTPFEHELIISNK